MGGQTTRLNIKKIWPELTVKRLGSFAIAILIIIISWVGLWSADADLTSRSIRVDGTPMQFVVAKGAKSVPGVLIAHGYCGSKQLMRGYASTLAHNGYGVLLWDLPGHGANPHPFEYDSLESSFDVPFATLKAQPEVNTNQLAVVGHSMGSGIAMEGAIAHSNEIDAVVAISPTGAPVTPNTPKNLSLQLGAWESFLQENAERLLREAGGENRDLSQGKGRSLSVIQNAEHATILFKDQSHQETLAWLNQTFGLTQQSPFRDRRMAWYGIHLLGWLGFLGTALPLVSQEDRRKPTKISLWRSLVGLVIAPIVGAGSIKVLGLITSVENFGGVMIGGALGVWFLVTGALWLAIIGKYPTLKRRDIGIGLIGFTSLWMGCGAMAQVVWLPWFLTLHRLILWGIIAIACLPWFIAFHAVLSGSTKRQRLGWWLAHSMAVLGGLILAILAAPNIGFLAIMLPAFPLLFGIFSFLEAKAQSIWGSAFACSFILSWLIMVPFPIL